MPTPTPQLFPLLPEYPCSCPRSCSAPPSLCSRSLLQAQGQEMLFGDEELPKDTQLVGDGLSTGARTAQWRQESNPLI